MAAGFTWSASRLYAALTVSRCAGSTWAAYAVCRKATPEVFKRLCRRRSLSFHLSFRQGLWMGPRLHQTYVCSLSLPILPSLKRGAKLSALPTEFREARSRDHRGRAKVYCGRGTRSARFACTGARLAAAQSTFRPCALHAIWF